MKKLSIILVMLLLSVSSAFACSCMMPDHPLVEADEATSVFIGKVTNITTIEKKLDSFSTEINKVNFDILYNIKNTEDEKLEISTAKDSATCGYNFEVWEEYIVYSYKNDDNELSVSLCSRTALLENAIEDIQTFNIEISDEWKIVEKISDLTWTWQAIMDDIENIIKQAENDIENNMASYTSTGAWLKKNMYIWIAIAILAIALIIIGWKTIKN